MAIINNLKKQVDLPTWEWLRFAPAASAAASSACSSPNSNYIAQHGQYIYYLIGSASFWRYDTYSDTYMQLSSPPYCPSYLEWIGIYRGIRCTRVRTRGYK